jgi:ABC-type transport system involved in multi-copper enzyme maturation permease subunit
MSSTVLIPTGDRPRTQPAPSAPSLLLLTRVELRKSADTRAGRWLLVAIAAAALLVAGLQLFFDDGLDGRFASFFTASQFPVGILLPVLGILLVTSEWSQRTAMTTFALVPVRSRVLTAKMLAAAVLAVLGVAATAVVSALATALVPAVTEHGSSWELTGAHLGQVLLVQIASVLVGLAFGMVLLSSPLAVVVYFVLPIAVTILVNTVGALAWVRDWLDLSTTSLPMYEGLLEGQGWAQVGTSAALWLLLPLVLGWVRIQRSEIA